MRKQVDDGPKAAEQMIATIDIDIGRVGRRNYTRKEILNFSPCAHSRRLIK